MHLGGMMRSDDKVVVAPPKAIGRGATACVFRPAIACDGRLLDNSKVSKIYRSKANADNDWAIDTKIGAIDPGNMYSVKAYSKCDLLREHVPKEYFSDRCARIGGEAGPVDNWDLPAYTQIIYEYAGISYRSYMEIKPFLEEYMRAILPLFYGLELFHAHGTTHGDISLANVAYNLEKDYFILLDFGNGNGSYVATEEDFSSDSARLPGQFFRDFFLSFERRYDDAEFYKAFPHDAKYKDSLKSLVFSVDFTFQRLYDYARDQFGIVFDPTTGKFIS